MDIHTLQTAIDTIEGHIRRLHIAGAGGTDWTDGVMAGMEAAKNDLCYILDTELQYRDSRATKEEV